MTQCLFGEHLLTRYPERIVALVEAEKTAVIGAGFIPEYVWLATGGRSGVNDRVDILKNRKILVFADVLIRWKQAPDTTDTAGPAGTGAERAETLLERRNRPGRRSTD